MKIGECPNCGQQFNKATVDRMKFEKWPAVVLKRITRLKIVNLESSRCFAFLLRQAINGCCQRGLKVTTLLAAKFFHQLAHDKPSRKTLHAQPAHSSMGS